MAQTVVTGHDIKDGAITDAKVAVGAAIDAAKIADGSVSNAEFQYLGGVTSDLQTQINGKAASSHNHAASAITSGVVPVARGGTGADLSSTGGTGQYVKQDSAGGVFTAGVIGASDIPSGIDASKIGGGSVSNAEFGYLDGVTSAIQTQFGSGIVTNPQNAIRNTVTITDGSTQQCLNLASDDAVAGHTSTFLSVLNSYADGSILNLLWDNDQDAGWLTLGVAEIGPVNVVFGGGGGISLYSGSVQTTSGDFISVSGNFVTQSGYVQFGGLYGGASIRLQTPATILGGYVLTLPELFASNLPLISDASGALSFSKLNISALSASGTTASSFRFLRGGTSDGAWTTIGVGDLADVGTADFPEGSVVRSTGEGWAADTIRPSDLPGGIPPTKIGAGTLTDAVLSALVQLGAASPGVLPIVEQLSAKPVANTTLPGVSVNMTSAPTTLPALEVSNASTASDGSATVMSVPPSLSLSMVKGLRIRVNGADYIIPLFGPV